MKKFNKIIIHFDKESSSIIKKVIWKNNDKTLAITFRNNNQTYVYFNIEFDEINSFLQSESIGKYFSQNIRNKYKFLKKGETTDG